MIKERILNLLTMCMDAKEKGHDCFFNYAPHCEKVEIRVHKCGWKRSDKDELGEYIPGTDNLTATFMFYTDICCDCEITEAETYMKGLLQCGITKA